MSSPLHFSGAFTLEEYSLLSVYISNRKVELNGILIWTTVELAANGTILGVERDPTTKKLSRLNVTPNTRLSQLIEHYKRNGGNPLDLDIPAIYDPKIPQNYTRGDADTPAMLVNKDGSEKDVRVHNDTYAAVAVHELKEFFIPSIKSKLSRWEYKILKTVDYSDKLISIQSKIEDLTKEDGSRSIQSLMTQVEIIMSDSSFPRAGSDLNAVPTAGDSTSELGGSVV